MIQLKKIVLFYFLFICLLTDSGAQNLLYPSAVNIETEIDEKVINAKSLSSLLQVNETTSEIALKIEVFSVITSNNVLDTMLQKLNNSVVVFLKGDFPIKNLSFVSSNNEDERSFVGKAQLTINGITRVQNYTCAVYNLKESDNLSSYNNAAYPLNINLFFEFEPEDFKLNAIYQPFVNGVKVEVAKGFINKLTAESESLFK